jgi:uncharacterized protein (TIGR02246 family)
VSAAGRARRVSKSAHAAACAGIAELHARWARAIERGDAAALADLVTEDYEVWANGTPALTGRAAVTDAMRGALARYDVAPAFDSLELIVAGDWAFERGIEQMRVAPRTGGDAQTRTQRALLLMRRDEDGRWRYARGMRNAPPDVPASPSGG